MGKSTSNMAINLLFAIEQYVCNNKWRGIALELLTLMCIELCFVRNVSLSYKAQAYIERRDTGVSKIKVPPSALKK